MTRRPKPPVRLQLSRDPGFSLAKASAKANDLPYRKVDRSTEWGNHYVVLPHLRYWMISKPGTEGLDRRTFGTRDKAVEEAVRLHALDCEAIAPRIRQHLAGTNLACWCKPGTPCHADTLLRIANAVPVESGTDQ